MCVGCSARLEEAFYHNLFVFKAKHDLFMQIVENHFTHTSRRQAAMNPAEEWLMMVLSCKETEIQQLFSIVRIRLYDKFIIITLN